MQEDLEGNPQEITISVEENEYSIVPGEHREIALKLQNPGKTQDYFEIGVLGLPASWTMLSKQVGQIAPDEEQEITLTIQPPPPPQTRAGIYPIKVVVFSQSKPTQKAEVEITLRVAVFDSRGRIGVLMDSVQFAAAPGSAIDIPILLANQGLETDTFRLSVDGLPVNWVSTQTPMVHLEAGKQKDIKLIIQPIHAPSSKAGRHPFKIKIISQLVPDDLIEVNCILTISAYHQFKARLGSEIEEAGAPIQLIIDNDGNIDQIFHLTWHGLENDLIFEAILPVPAEEQSQKDSKAEQEIVPLNDPFPLRIPPGQAGAVTFRGKPAKRNLIGDELAYAYTVDIQITENDQQKEIAIQGKITSRPLLPTWVLVALVVILASFACLFFFLVRQNNNNIASATETASSGTAVAIIGTQTASANQTAAADNGQKDSDGDGLTDNEEIQIGTDPYNFDTDADELGDGREVKELKTNPLNPDTDNDSSRDGREVQIGTNPLVPDTDNDELLDGQENPPCPNPLDPDSDKDGIIDGKDLDPCDPRNPSMTATAVAGQPPTQVPPTQAPPTETPPTEAPQDTPNAPPALPGTIAFSSNRDGNLEIYAQKATDGSVIRLTNDPSADMQPSWSPNGNRIAFTTNRDGNNEIYLMNSDGSNLINLTNNPGDDQNATWSPDGQWLAFASNRDGNWEIYKISADGITLENITNHPNDDLYPSWSRSGGLFNRGELIVFTTNRDGNFEIYSMGTDGANLTNLTNHPAEDLFPAMSNNGSFIAFASNRDGARDIFRMSSDGRAPVNLTNDQDDDLHPSWSPDNTWIAYGANQDIRVIKSDGTVRSNFTNNPAGNDFPSWR